ncbi:MAG: 4Fe-4S dicluster domain-containing protein, partial [bacterium]|nr:4Fe-4S dicluster domain-containing protein [bacterium]
TPNFDDFSFVKYPSSLEEGATDVPKINLKGNRTRESVKAFFFDIRETVATFPQEAETGLLKPVQRAIVGLKACDLRALKPLDLVFMETEPIDPFYKLRREGTLLITADCNDFGETCFCNLHGENPFAESGFDLNLSTLAKGILVTVGSERGAQQVEEGNKYFREATGKEIEERNHLRQGTRIRLQEQNESFEGAKPFYDRIKNNLEHSIWHSLSHRCVGCCGCLSICPTCHCFLLVDRRREEYYERERVWDFCIYPRYARVAGGGNPRPELYKRLRNRFVKKFQFFKEKCDFYACVGCGRCSDVCPADIEIRDVLKELG